MKNIIKYLFIGLFSVLMFGGCASSNITYINKLVNKHVNKNLNTVKNISVGISDLNSTTISKKPEKGYKMALFTYNLNSKDVNLNILNTFTSQYFNHVNIDNDASNLVIKSKITDFQWYLHNIKDDAYITLNLFVEIYINQKKVFEKTYISKEYNSKGLLIVGKTYGLVKETTHKALFNLYETQVKPDLIKVIKENYGRS